MLSIAIVIAAVSSPLQLMNADCVTAVITGITGAVTAIGVVVVNVQPVVVSVAVKV